LDIVHPAARILTDIARSQDAEVGDGTTSVVVLAGEILKEVRGLVEQGVSSQTIIKGLRRASAMAVNKVKEIAVDMMDASESQEKKVQTLRRLAGTAMNSKLIKRNSDFFTKSEDPLPSACNFAPRLTSWYLSGCGCGTFAGPE
jgi:T-complex protein 1 subunit eta